jgi:dTDP-4-dehydro-6-deoxy-alpha-D-glucopyranose 2,3-dehydratase
VGKECVTDDSPDEEKALTTTILGGSTVFPNTAGTAVPLQIARSAHTSAGITAECELRRWFSACGERNYTHVRRVPLEALERWSTDPNTGDIRHDSGKFFAVEGLAVERPGGPVPAWSQPIINQPEVGILGILAKEFDGVLHFLMQSKVEPGNCNGVQLSPTVQATRSNYTRVHQGEAVPYLEHFVDARKHRVIADVRQSEQGSWFFQKRNRNMIVDVGDADVEVLEDFRWLTLGQLHALLAEPHVVNMDARTVLSCLPFTAPGLAVLATPVQDGFTRALLHACDDQVGAQHPTGEILSWITDARARHDVTVRRIPLGEVTDWVRTETGIAHVSGRFFTVMGVDVRAGGREVRGWCQPMLQPAGTGLAAFLVRRIGDVLHLLVHARVEPGDLDVSELAPTVQCTVDNYAGHPPAARPRFLDEVLTAPPERIRFDTVLSEEGGRFHHARTRYMVVETDGEADPDDHPDHRWMPLHQLVELLRHSHYVNVEARSLVACLHSLFAKH